MKLGRVPTVIRMGWERFGQHIRFEVVVENPVFFKMIVGVATNLSKWPSWSCMRTLLIKRLQCGLCVAD